LYTNCNKLKKIINLDRSDVYFTVTVDVFKSFDVSRQSIIFMKPVVRR